MYTVLVYVASYEQDICQGQSAAQVKGHTNS